MIEHQLAVKVYPATQTEAETKKMRKLTWKRLVPPSRGWSPSRCSAVFGAGLRFHKEVSGGSGGNSANHRQNSITQQPSPQGAHGVSGSMSGISPECLRPRLRVLGLGFGAINPFGGKPLCSSPVAAGEPRTTTRKAGIWSMP